MSDTQRSPSNHDATHNDNEALYVSIRVHTGPPAPPFGHCAHDSPQPPDETPDQLRDVGAAARQVPDTGLANCWTMGAGRDAAVEPLEDAPPPPELTFKRYDCRLDWDPVAPDMGQTLI